MAPQAGGCPLKGGAIRPPVTRRPAHPPSAAPPRASGCVTATPVSPLCENRIARETHGEAPSMEGLSSQGGPLLDLIAHRVTAKARGHPGSDRSVTPQYPRELAFRQCRQVNGHNALVVPHACRGSCRPVPRPRSPPSPAGAVRQDGRGRIAGLGVGTFHLFACARAGVLPVGGCMRSQAGRSGGAPPGCNSGVAQGAVMETRRDLCPLLSTKH